jgi:protein-disulfide isomerase
VTLAQIQVRYPNKVRIVHRDFPVDSSHPLARKAAEGGRCANEQGKFWSYHDKLYTIGLNPDPNQLKQVAKELGLDMAAFEKCLDNHKYAAAVQKDVEQGMQLGITGTPAFYINGRMISGAQPLDAFVRIIDEEMKGSGDGR